MAIKKISFYQLSAGSKNTVDVEPVPITFNPALEKWAFSVALTRVAMPSDSQFAVPSITAAAGLVVLTSDRTAEPLFMTHGTSEEYGRLTSLQLGVVADYGIAVDALLTLYEYDLELERPGKIEKPTARETFGA